MPESAAWPSTLQEVFCENCDWRYLLPAQQLPLTCPHCCQTELTMPEAEDVSPFLEYAPERLLPFTVSEADLNRRIEQFAGGIWFAPGDLTPDTLKARLHRLYLPMWLVDSQLQAVWQAEAGFNYEAVSHRDQFNQQQGGWTSQQITETRIRWEPRVGRLQREYHNTPAPALDEHATLLKQLGQFEVSASQPYQPQALEGVIVRLPNRSPTDAWPEAVPPLQTSAAEECRQASQADHIRQFRWKFQTARQHWTLLLLPLYVAYYLDDGRQPQPVLIHGQTGHLSGPRRASMRRARQVALAIVGAAVALFIISLILGVGSLLLPPLLLFAGLGVLLAVIVGMLAIAPLIIAWQFNRTQPKREES